MSSPTFSPEIAAGNSPAGVNFSSDLFSSDAEFRFLLACCAMRKPREAAAGLASFTSLSFDWQRFLRLAEHHGVVPFVYECVRSAPLEIPQTIADEVRGRYENNARRNLLFVAELFRVLDCLEAHGIEGMPYKGPVLAEMVYGDVAQREFSDLDVLIAPNDVGRAKEALKALQYAPNLALSSTEERAYLRSGYEYTFDGPLGRNLLEIQWAIVPRFFAVDFSVEDFFERAAQVDLGGRKVKTLSSEDLLLALCVHEAKHAWTRLCWLRDVAGLMQDPRLEWNVVLQRARELGVERVLQISLALANGLLGADAPEKVMARVGKDATVRELAEESAERISESEGYRTDTMEYFRLMLRLRERASDRLRLVSRLAFTPSVNEWRLVRLPAGLFPLYRVVRMYRLAGRLLGARSRESLS
jgi:Uncharacterised nucleotidyltransferase